MHLSGHIVLAAHAGIRHRTLFALFAALVLVAVILVVWHRVRRPDALQSADKRPHQARHAKAPATQATRSRIWPHIARLAFLLSAFLLSLVAWLAHTWSDLSTDEILFHLRASLAGTDTTTIWSYCLRYLPFVIAGCVLDFWLIGRSNRRAKLRTATLALTTLASACMLGGALWGFARMVDLSAFLFGGSGEDFIGEHYVDPSTADITFPKTKRNLVYIFLESMELTYADEENGGAWPENLIPELCELAHEGETFSDGAECLEGALVLPGCTWTMGGMFAQSSGVPLKIPVRPTHADLVLEDFFPGLTCLGDLLEEQGYQQHVLFGSNAEFGNRKDYYLEHGNFDIYDYRRALDEGYIPKGYKVWWGFEDEKLFEKAKDIMSKAAAEEQPFNVTLLTVDTHFEDGYVCRLCDDEHGDNQYANVISCSSRQVAEFVRWIQAQDFYDNTTIIINGDHTTMDKDFCNDVPDSYQRKTFTAVINSAAQREDDGSARQYATIDLFPTTLAALGCTIPGGRLGIGTNLYARTLTIIEEFGLEECVAACNRQSEFLNSYSQVTTGAELVDKVLANYPIELVYKDTGKEETTGLVYENANAFSKDLIEEAYVVLVDTRTGAERKIEAHTYLKNSNNPTKYTMVAPVSLSDEERKHYRADAYLGIEGDTTRLVASWGGATEETE